MTKPMATTTALSRKGIRQPHDRSWSSGSCATGQERRGGEDQARLRAAQREAGEECPPFRRRVLEGQRIRARLLAGGGESLAQPQEDEKDRRGNADLAVSRQTADQESRQAHQQQREHQHPFAAVFVADMPHEERAHRPRHVAHAERGERQKGGGRRMAARKEDLAEHQRGAGAVDEEVVVLERAADPAGECRLFRRSRAGVMMDAGRAWRDRAPRNGHLLLPSL